jgi:hypothetical protein
MFFIIMGTPWRSWILAGTPLIAVDDGKLLFIGWVACLVAGGALLLEALQDDWIGSRCGCPRSRGKGGVGAAKAGTTGTTAKAATPSAAKAATTATTAAHAAHAATATVSATAPSA